jgi:flagellar biosynthetic protein FliR
MRLTEAMLLDWLGSYAWPFIRIAAAVMAAPLFGTRALPTRIRLTFALLLTVVMAPLLPAAPPLAFFSGDALLLVVCELLIGLVLGLSLQVLFEAMRLGGELLSSSMGLSFAQMNDPLRGSASPVLSNFLQVLAVLSFLSLGGHLALVEWLKGSFALQPVSAVGPSTAMLMAFVLEGSHLFAGGVAIALPGVCALLLVNLAFGVMNRAAPALNMMSVGFPVALGAGLIVLALSLGSIQSVFAGLFTALWERMPGVLGG